MDEHTQAGKSTKSTFSLKIGPETIYLETGAIARQADASVLIRQRETVILVTVLCEPDEKPDQDFFPLTVDYRERTSAGGFIPGGYLKRESRSSDHETLTSRLIDRSIRPLFPKHFNAETQVIATVLSADQAADPAILSILGASVALMLSPIPWNGPVIGMRIAQIGDTFVPFPPLDDLKNASLSVVLSAGKQGLVMVEGGAREVEEAVLVDALLTAQEYLSAVFDRLIGWTSSLSKEKWTIKEPERHPTLEQAVNDLLRPRICSIFGQPLAKLERKKLIKQQKNDVISQLSDGTPEQQTLLTTLCEACIHETIRSETLSRQTRLDGRGLTEIRSISGETSWLPRAHGSSLFTRGETQAMVSCSLGTSRDEQIVETLFGVERKHFLLHYNFPPFSVGEIRPLRGPGRREIGHGALAARALEPVLPAHDSFPYTIRIVSDISESNGSSSMATVCGGCLALLDAGVPLVEWVAGIAMGLISHGDSIAVLSDILGDEDHLGDMDFKVTGTRRGITAVQMDNKLGSLKREILEKALLQAREGRMHILSEMQKIMTSVKSDISPRAPRVLSLKIKQNKIRDLIGPGGKTIQELQLSTRTKIEIDDEGRVKIYADDLDAAQLAMQRIQDIAAEVEVGKVYNGQITGVKPFGIFVRIMPNTEGLVHVSELVMAANTTVEQSFKEGDKINVMAQGVDKMGRLKLSQKAVN